MKEICKLCEGKGFRYGEIDPVFAVMTLGMTALMDMSIGKKRCKMCEGDGFVRKELSEIE